MCLWRIASELTLFLPAEVAHCATTTPSAAVPRCHAPSLPPASSRARAFASSCAVTSDERPSHPPATAKEAATPHTGSSRSTATFLLEQALREEAEEERILQAKKRARQPKELQEPAWDGDEPQARAIRRILEDQYKPLRVKVSFGVRLPAEIVLLTLYPPSRVTSRRFSSLLHFPTPCLPTERHLRLG